MLSDEGSNALKAMLLKMSEKIASKGFRIVSRVARRAANKLYISTANPYKKRSLKALVRKNPNAGIYETDVLKSDAAKYVAKQLKKFHQDFTVSKTDDGDFVITTTSNNKNLCDNIQNSFRNIQTKKDKKDNRESFQTKLNRVKQKFDLQQNNRNSLGLDLLKYKQPSKGAR